MKLPRVNLRDLFWLVLVAAMGCAWWVHHREMRKLQAELDNQKFWREYDNHKARELGRLYGSLHNAVRREGYSPIGGAIGEIRLERDEAAASTEIETEP